MNTLSLSIVQHKSNVTDSIADCESRRYGIVWNKEHVTLKCCKFTSCSILHSACFERACCHNHYLDIKIGCKTASTFLMMLCSGHRSMRSPRACGSGLPQAVGLFQAGFLFIDLEQSSISWVWTEATSDQLQCSGSHASYLHLCLVSMQQFFHSVRSSPVSDQFYDHLVCRKVKNLQSCVPVFLLPGNKNIWIFQAHSWDQSNVYLKADYSVFQTCFIYFFQTPLYLRGACCIFFKILINFVRLRIGAAPLCTTIVPGAAMPPSPKKVLHHKLETCSAISYPLPVYT